MIVAESCPNFRRVNSPSIQLSPPVRVQIRVLDCELQPDGFAPQWLGDLKAPV
jgi:hypothetical protein